MRFFISIGVLVLLAGQLKAQGLHLISLNQLEQRFSQGKDTVYLVNFWATWCAPCVEELPYFERLRQVNKSGGLKVLLVSLDFKSKLETDLKPFVKRMNLRSEVFLLDETDQQSFINRVDKDWSGNIPATLIINTSRQRRQFIARELNYSELLNIYQSNK